VNRKHPAGPPLKSRIVKRATLVDGRNTSVTLEDEFWIALKEIAATQNVGISQLISTIDNQRQSNNNLSSAIRVYVLSYYNGSMARKLKQRPVHR
jgi:predicted DNA-binding ribbon-helix-helix protein